LSTAAEPASVGSVPEDEKQSEVAKNAGKKLADSGNAYLRWAKGVADTVPNVQKMVDVGDLIYSTFDDGPDTIKLTYSKEIGDGLASAQSFFDAQQPATRQFNFGPISDGSGASGATASANYVAMDLHTLLTSANPALHQWAKSKLVPLQKLQQADLNKATIASKLELLHPGSGAEFLESVTEYEKCRSGTAPTQAAGILMRNVFDHLYGNLLELARNRGTLKTKNAVPWSTLAPLIAHGGVGSVETSQLVAFGKVYMDLKGKLTNLAKREDRAPDLELEAAYSEYLAFLFAVLGWVDLGAPA
jgi:hypothetical protein